MTTLPKLIRQFKNYLQFWNPPPVGWPIRVKGQGSIPFMHGMTTMGNLVEKAMSKIVIKI